MAVIKEYKYPSKTGLADIYAKGWLPEDPSTVKALFQITHGMAEHADRYDDFADYLCSRGFAVFCSEHIGHGRSVKSDDDLGCFGESNGWDAFVEDARTLTNTIKSDYPGLPIIFFGHSMGSFVAREYAARYGSDEDIKGFVFCGTSGTNPAASAGILMAKSIAKIKGSRHRSKFIDKIAFGSYNKNFAPQRTAFDWLTRDTEIVDKYIADKYCGFLFTAAGFADMFTILDKVSSKEWYASLNKDKPVLLTAGALDPVGSCGKGVTQVYNDIKSAGVKDASIMLFDDCRHEILNEINRADVYKAIADWCVEKLS